MTIIIIHIQKYNVTTQGIKLSKMPLFYEIKNFIKLTLKKKKKKKKMNIYKPGIHLQKAHSRDCYKTMFHVLIYDSSKT